jgi:hypothetical protein
MLPGNAGRKVGISFIMPFPPPNHPPWHIGDSVIPLLGTLLFPLVVADVENNRTKKKKKEQKKKGENEGTPLPTS